MAVTVANVSEGCLLMSATYTTVIDGITPQSALSQAAQIWLY
jgi:hypothetical protein